MAVNGIITLLSDFGTTDHYVGEVKGAMLRVCTSLRLVDITHDVGPQDIEGASYVLGHSAFAFPPGTVHYAVVDPAVGTARALLACHCQNHFFVLPDNGLLTWVLAGRDFTCRRLEFGPDQMPLCRTFHGRDLLAPTAARLASGALHFDDCGPEISPFILQKAPPVRVEDRLNGHVIRWDRFGNLVTNVSRDDLQGAGVMAVEIGGSRLDGLAQCYGDGVSGDLIALVGSDGFLEISVVMGHAAQILNAVCGMPISVLLESSQPARKQR